MKSLKSIIYFLWIVNSIKRCRLILIYTFIFITCSSYCQNLVPNGDFESMVFCPNNFNQVWAATSWSPSANNHNPVYGTEYMNSCNIGNFGVPNNHFGSQSAHSGSGYMAPVMLAPTVGPNYRENIFTKLTTTMVIGATYSVSMYVSHTDNSQHSSNNIGIKFSTIPDFPINNISHLYSTSTISNSIVWTQVSGTFIADSLYQYICVGNFFDDNNTTQTVTCPGCSYNLFGYYIDDIFVSNVVQPPIASFIADSQNICEGETINFSDSSVNALNYSWNFGNGTTSILQNPSCTYSLSGVYSVSLTVQNGTLTSQTVKSVTVNPTPNIIPGSSSYTICQNQSQLLAVSGANTYTWSPNTGLSGTNQFSTTANPINSINYKVVGSNTFGCKDSSLFIVTVLPSPTITLNPNTAICLGVSNSATLSATGAVSYTWSTGSTTASISVSPSITTNYTVSGTSGICTGQTTVNVNVIPSPTITIAGNTTICPGQPTTLTAIGASGYTWQPTGLTTQSISVQPLTGTVYTVTGSNGFCSSSANASVTVLPSPTLSVNSPSICVGQTATLTANSTSGYTWSPSGLTTQSISVQPATTSIYTVSSSNGICTSIANSSVTVLAFPVLAVNSLSICSGQSGTLTAAGASTYTWLPTGQTTSSIVVSPTANTIYTITGSNGVCSADFNNAVTVLPLPVLSVNSITMCAGETQPLIANGAITYSWFPVTNLSSSTGSSVNTNATTTKIYTVTGTSTLGCNNSISSTVTVIPNPGLSVATSTNFICSGSNVTLTGSGASAGSYTWSSLPVSSINLTTGNPITVSPTVTTLYTLSSVVGSIPDVCTFTANVTVNVIPNLLVLTGYVDPVCFGSYTTLTAKGGNKYNWVPVTGMSYPNDSVTKVFPATTTIYTVTVSKNGVCPQTGTVQVVVKPIPYVYAGIDTTINIDEHIVLTGTGSVDVGFILSTGPPLACNFCSQITVNPQENTCYILKGTNEYDCASTDTVCVTITKDWDIFIPNAFTPNGDNENDIFIPVGYGLSEIQLTIFDRWGSLIFKSNGDKIGWDGTCKGKICQQDIYIYQAEISNMAGYSVKRTGHVTLLPRIK